jgi:hypothetical protein
MELPANALGRVQQRSLPESLVVNQDLDSINLTAYARIHLRGILRIKSAD